jgi:hypothetical protein
MIGPRLLPLLALSLWAGPAQRASTLTITVTNDPPSSTAEIRVVATNGRISAAGQTSRATNDTVRVHGTVELTISDPITMATFITDQPGHRIRAVVQQDGAESLQGRGELIVVTRTPAGPQIQAMALPAELRRAP